MAAQFPELHPERPVDGHWFVDPGGRRLLLRGVNLAGSSKVPYEPDGATHRPTDFSDHRTVSFTGRPFPLDEADAHYRRLRHWGFNCLRFLTTWEAIEHAGPEQYDEAYLDYLYQVVRKAGEHGFLVFIDPHQDVWSRMTGGDGAPGWTLALAGFDIGQLDAAEAAITMQARYPDYGQMIWSNNAHRLGSATMFTLFFAGERFAPNLQIEGESIQHYLQRHFINAICQVAERMVDLPHVIGYDSLNEPASGYAGIADLNDPLPVAGSAPQLTGFQSMIVGAGFPVEVPLLQQQGIDQVRRGTIRLNPEGVSAWRDPALDPWRAHGVWEVDEGGRPRLLQPDYFKAFDFWQEGLQPFIRRYGAAVRSCHPGTLLFIESEPNSGQNPRWKEAPKEGIVNASHWYDLLTLLTKRYDPGHALVWGRPGQKVSGVEAVHESYEEQIADIVEASQRQLDGAPTLIGEFGVPFDLEEGAAYESGDFSSQAAALSAYYDALDTNLVHATLWNYTPDNTNRWGDQWNQEDLSIFSRNQQANPEDPDSGGRAIAGFCRPYVRACRGTPEYMRFVPSTGEFRLVMEADPGDQPTEIYLPRFHYPHGYHIEISNGQIEHDLAGQRLLWHTDEDGPQWLAVRRTEVPEEDQQDDG